jgi:hypothetical protein
VRTCLFALLLCSSAAASARGVRFVENRPPSRVPVGQNPHAMPPLDKNGKPQHRVFQSTSFPKVNRGRR